MTRILAALLLVLTTAGCSATLGLPTQGDWEDQDTSNLAETADDTDMADTIDEPPAPVEEDPFVPPFPGDELEDEAPVCVFGESAADWANDAELNPTDFEHVVHGDDLGALELDQLRAGFRRWDFFDFTDLDDLFAVLDGNRILVRDIDVLDIDRSYTHLRLHFRGLEFGFVFVAGTDRPVAAIEDGHIIGCSIVR